MSRARIVKTNFTGGEVTPFLRGRADLSAYENGAARLKNVFVHPTGGATRRPGFRYIATARGPGRLLAFEFNTEQTYLFVLTGGWIDIYQGSVHVGTLETSWNADQIYECDWTQTADTLLVVHPDVSPKRVTRQGADTWAIADWRFVEEKPKPLEDAEPEDVLLTRRPFYKFADPEVTLTPTEAGDAIILTASADVFIEAHVGLIFRIGKKQVTIDAVTDATTATATVIQELGEDAIGEAETDWEEPTFSAVRGWPGTITFHQDRLVIGGSRDQPNRLWLSKSGDLFNFDLGEGLDDESIEFPILSDQVNAIRAIFSGRHLQVFTTGGEWMLTGDPVTPSTVQLRRQTRVGSPGWRKIPPRDVDGATLFASRNGRELREFLFADVEQAYQASDLGLLAKHILRRPLDQDYQDGERLFYQVLEDGRIAVVTIYRAEKVTAWSTIETAGAFRAVAVVGDDLFVLVDRGSLTTIERLDLDCFQDCATVLTAPDGVDAVVGMERLEGRMVSVMADGAVLGVQKMFGGRVMLGRQATNVTVGLPYEHEIQGLPPAFPMAGGAAPPGAYRIVRARFRLKDTAGLALDVGRGMQRQTFRKVGQSVLDQGAEPYTGDHEVRAVGWRRDGDDAPWRIADDLPLPFTLLSVGLELKVSE